MNVLKDRLERQILNPYVYKIGSEYAPAPSLPGGFIAYVFSVWGYESKGPQGPVCNAVTAEERFLSQLEIG